MVKADWKFVKNKASEKLITQLIEAKDVFASISAKGLEEKALFALGKCYYLRNNRDPAAEKTWNEGLNLAESLKDRKMETAFREKLSTISLARP